MSNTTSGEKPGKDTPNKKAAGGCKTTTATIRNATQIIAICARIKGATARFMPRFEWVPTAETMMMTEIMVLIAWGVL